MNRMANQNQASAAADSLASAHKSALIGFYLVAAFTVVNIVLAATGGDLYMMFSAFVPYYVSANGLAFYNETQDVVWMILGVGISVLLTVPYVLCGIFGKKSKGWLVGGTVYYGIETLLFLFLVIMMFGFDAAFLMPLVFHGVVLYCLIKGIISMTKLKIMQAAAPVPTGTDASSSDIPEQNNDGQ